MIIGLAGGTGSGKTAIVRGVITRVGGCVIDLESYTLERSALPEDDLGSIGDAPRRIDTPLLVAHLGELRRGYPIDKPIYCPKTQTRVGVEVVAPARLVLVEGLFTLWWRALRTLLDVKVFVDAPADLRLIRRVRREAAEHGRPAEPGPYQDSSAACLTHERYVEPTRVHADHVVLNDGPLDGAVEQVIALIRRTRVDGLAPTGVTIRR